MERLESLETVACRWTVAEVQTACPLVDVLSQTGPGYQAEINHHVYRGILHEVQTTCPLVCPITDWTEVPG